MQENSEKLKTLIAMAVKLSRPYEKTHEHDNHTVAVTQSS